MISKSIKALALTSLFMSQGLLAEEFNGYIVKFKDSSSFISPTVLGQFGKISKVVETSHGRYAKLDANASLSTQTLNAISNNDLIEYIEPNYIVRTMNTTPTDGGADIQDAKFDDQWGLFNDGKGGGLFSRPKKGEDINALKAWSITTGSKEIKVAVIDTGVDYTHPDLKNQMDVNELELNGLPGVDDDGNGYVDDIYGYNFADKNGNPIDKNGHGTHCAGVIGAEHNSIGIAGIMKEVKIIGIQFLSASGSGETINAIESINYAISRGVHVMNNSWGGSGKSKALEEAIIAAHEAGIVFVAAAGNDSSNNDKRPTYPANYDVPNVISVASFTSAGKRSLFSNHGVDTVHVAAPGSKIMSTYKGGYKNLDGTSMAAPHVAGIAGLILASEPSLSPVEVKERLMNTSTKTDNLRSTSTSAGRVNAYEALK